MDVEAVESAIKQIIDEHGSDNFLEVSPMEASLVDLLRKINWFPIEGEWCWFNNAGRSSTVAQFQENSKDKYVDAEGHEWDECYVFEGDLPKHLNLGLQIV